eukprot:gene21938-28984_t
MDAVPKQFGKIRNPGRRFGFPCAGTQSSFTEAELVELKNASDLDNVLDLGSDAPPWGSSMLSALSASISTDVLDSLALVGLWPPTSLSLGDRSWFMVDFDATCES